MIEIDVLLSYKEAQDYDFSNKTALAIDTFRATSTIITALAKGIKEIYPVASIKQAKEVAKREDALLAGERGAEIISGFDFDNSPRFSGVNRFSKDSLVLTTSNGTKLFQSLQGAKAIYILSLLNRKRISNFLADKTEPLVFCCAGKDGDFVLDDFITAGAVIAELAGKDLKLSDKALTAKEIYLAKKDKLNDFIKQAGSVKLLEKLGKNKDIEFILTEEFNLLPYYIKEEEKIILG